MDIDGQCGEPFTDTRDKIIVRTSTVGIVTNVFRLGANVWESSENECRKGN